MSTNADVTYHIGNSVLADCMGCQTPEGRKVTGLRTRKGIPVDTYNIDWELSDGMKGSAVMCIDCLIVAQNQEVRVFRDGEVWKRDHGFLLRPELAEEGSDV